MYSGHNGTAMTISNQNGVWVSISDHVTRADGAPSLFIFAHRLQRCCVGAPRGESGSAETRMAIG